MTTPLALAGWLAFAYAAMSLVEYAAHRWPMHSRRFARRFPWARRAWEQHAALHHGRFYRGFAGDPDPAAKHVGLDLGPAYVVAGTAPLWAALALLSPRGAAVFVAVAALHGAVWTAIHREMHEPGGRWFARTRLYRFWLAYHRTHHEHPGRNFNAVLPLWDWLLGTYRRPRDGL